MCHDNCRDTSAFTDRLGHDLLQFRRVHRLGKVTDSAPRPPYSDRVPRPVAAQMGEPNRAIAATGVRLSFSTEVVASTFRDVDFDITRLIALDLEKGQEEQRTEK